MAKILVSIISEHLIPNYHLFKHLKDEIQEHVLITTTKMQENGATKNFINFIDKELHLIKEIVTDAWDFEDIYNDLKLNCENTSTNEYVVNLTGGTKMVSLGVFNFFSRLDSEMYYVAIGSNSCMSFYPKKKAIENFSHNLSLNEYLGLYGYEFSSTNKLVKSSSFTKDFFNRIKQKQFDVNNYELTKKALRHPTKIENLEDRGYYRGIWFEEYVYNLFKEKLELDETQIGLGVKVKKFNEEGRSHNEFDVMFVKDNKLCAIECKSSFGGKRELQIKNVETYLYKLSSAVHNFGLQVTPILALMGALNSRKITDRANILKIKTLNAVLLSNKSRLSEFVKTL